MLAAIVLLFLAAGPCESLWTVNSIGMAFNRYLAAGSESQRVEARRIAETALQGGSSTRSFWRTYGAVAATDPTEEGFTALAAVGAAGGLDRTATLWYAEVAAATGHWAEAQAAYERIDASNLLINRAEEAIAAGDETLAHNWLLSAARSLAASGMSQRQTSSDITGVTRGPGGEQIRDPGYPARAYLRIGRGFLELNEAASAEIWLRQAQAHAAMESPGLRIQQEIHFALAQALGAQPVEDERAFRTTRLRTRTLVARAIALGDSAWARVQAAKSLLPIFERAAAIRHCRAALELDPLFVEAYMQLGAILEEDGLEALARELYEQGHEVLPADEQLMTALALASWDTLSAEHALPILQEAAATCREPYVHAALGDCYAELGRFDEARHAYHAGLRLTPGAGPLTARLQAMPLPQGLQP